MQLVPLDVVQILGLAYGMRCIAQYMHSFTSSSLGTTPSHNDAALCVIGELLDNILASETCMERRTLVVNSGSVPSFYAT